MTWLRRDAGVVELDALEKRCALTGTVGSNPTLSAIRQTHGKPGVTEITQ